MIQVKLKAKSKFSRELKQYLKIVLSRIALRLPWQMLWRYFLWFKKCRFVNCIFPETETRAGIEGAGNTLENWSIAEEICD